MGACCFAAFFFLHFRDSSYREAKSWTLRQDWVSDRSEVVLPIPHQFTHWPHQFTHWPFIEFRSYSTRGLVWHHLTGDVVNRRHAFGILHELVSQSLDGGRWVWFYLSIWRYLKSLTRLGFFCSHAVACCRMLESKGFVVQAKKMAADWKLPEGWAVKLGKDGRLIKAGTTWQKLVGMRYWETTRKNGTRWNEMEPDGTRITNENNEHVMRAANSIIQQVLEESLLVDTLTWHDFPWLSRRWMVLVRGRSTTPRQQNAVNHGEPGCPKDFFSLFLFVFFGSFFRLEFWSGSGCESCRGQGVTENAG